MRKQVVFSLDAHLVVTQPRDSQLGFSPNHLFTIPRVGLRFRKPSGFLRFNQPISTKLYYRRIIWKLHSANISTSYAKFVISIRIFGKFWFFGQLI